MIFNPRCRCSHARNDHDNDEKCRPSCGCGEYRRARGEPGESNPGEPRGWMPGSVREEIAEHGSPRKPWVCHCGAVAPYSNDFPHWDCGGGRPLSPEEIAAREDA